MQTETIETTDQVRLKSLENIIDRGQRTFVEVGQALAEIRDSRLYREEFATFEEYCKERWGWDRSFAYRHIQAAEAVTEMLPMGNKNELPPVRSERQARELAKIKDPETRAKVWQQANQIAEEVSSTVTANVIKQAVQVQAIADQPSPQDTNDAITERQEHLDRVKNSPGTKWNNFLYEITLNLNSIRDNGGIAHLARRWSPTEKENYLRRLKRIRESVDQIAEQLEGVCKYDGN